MKNQFIQSNSSIITMTRGDTLMVPIFINMGTYVRPVRYSLMPGDRLFFSLTEPNQYFENGILKKTYDYTSSKNMMGDTILYLRPEDTEFLLPGQYYYEIKLQQIDPVGTEFVTTVVPKTLFNIV